VDDPRAVVMFLARHFEWTMQRRARKGTSPDASSMLEYRDGLTNTWIRWVEDRRVGVPYLEISAAGAEAIQDALASRVRPWSMEELLALWNLAESGSEVAIALVRLAIASGPTPAASTVIRIEAGFYNPNVEVRRAAALAAWVCDWPITNEWLRVRAGADIDTSVRRLCSELVGERKAAIGA